MKQLLWREQCMDKERREQAIQQIDQSQSLQIPYSTPDIRVHDIPGEVYKVQHSTFLCLTGKKGQIYQQRTLKIDKPECTHCFSLKYPITQGPDIRTAIYHCLTVFLKKSIISILNIIFTSRVIQDWKILPSTT